jgi:uncharacterized damage-inducible protein DinB
MPLITRPLPGEYAPYYDGYFRQLPAGEELLPLLQAQPAALAELLVYLTDAQATHPLAPGKWSVKQVLIHLIDCERVFAYRALAIARGEQQALPSFEQDDYVANAHVASRSVADLLAEHAAQRAATIALLAGISPTVHAATGTVAGRPVSVRALAWVIAAHETHHYRLFLAQLPAAK